MRAVVISPHSAPVMREYANFLLELAVSISWHYLPLLRFLHRGLPFLSPLQNDPYRANLLLVDAEQVCNLVRVPRHAFVASPPLPAFFLTQIEDELSRAFQSEPEVEPIFGAITDFDMSAESLALVSISMLPETRGLIEDINVSALRLLGFNKREVLGRDINAIIPAPIAAVHPALLDLFMGHGRPRVRLGLFCVPAYLTLKDDLFALRAVLWSQSCLLLSAA